MAAAERRLGRGLGSLLGAEPAPVSSGGVQEVPLDQIRVNPHQPRRIFEVGAMEELTESVRQHGVLQAIVVRRAGDGFELVAGERRTRAARAAGLAVIPATIRDDITDSQMLELALVENVQRQDLDPIERARGYRQMSDQLGLTQEQVADRVGLKRATVANHMRLLELPELAQQAVQSGLLSMGHARALLGLARPERIPELVGRIVREGLSVRDVEALVRAEAKPATTSPGATLTPAGSPPWIRELEQRMEERLGTKVTLRNQPGFRGQIVIEYFNRSDLDRVCQVLAPKPML
ncbi:MAG: ParB/RepB/Spo0J family partition protein [Planctomycetota bacterium]|nr:ParB/RepB/Spo0J family partition protein [Planctomycetota bacterium]